MTANSLLLQLPMALFVFFSGSAGTGLIAPDLAICTHIWLRLLLFCGPRLRRGIITITAEAGKLFVLELDIRHLVFREFQRILGFDLNP